MKRSASAMLLLVIGASLLNIPGQFINASLSAYYLYIIGITGFAILSATWLLKEPAVEPVYFNWLLLFYFGFSAYNVVNSMLSGSFNYKTTYALTGLLFVAALTIFGNRIRFGITGVLHGISVLGIAQGFICLLQLVKIVPVASPYFPVTGTWVNPNVTAMFMAMSVPAALDWLFAKKGRSRYWLLAGLVLIVTGLILLKCRTAFMGAGIAAFIIIQKRYRPAWRLKGYSWPKQLALLATGFILVAICAISLYNSKKASAESRKMVWRVCFQMLAEKPFSGYGYGSFEKNYNLYQANHLTYEVNSSPTRLTTGYVSMAYNELLETAVEGGIPALLLQLSLIVCLLIFPRLERKKELRHGSSARPAGSYKPAFDVAYAGIVAFIVMSLVNFTFQAIPVYAVFLVYFVILSRHPVYTINLHLALPDKRKRLVVKVTGFAMITLSGWMMVHFINEAKAHVQLKRAVVLARNGSVNEALRQLQPLENKLNNSEAFWRNRAYLQLISHQYQSARETLKKAAELSANPDISFALGYCYQQTGEWGLAIQQYRLAAQLEPQRLKPRYALMKLYYHTGDTLQMISMANQIIALPSKGNISEADKYKKEANKVLHKLKDFTQPDKVL